jgi:AraC family transcriptional regulator of adaptative response / methylphosphotriester-DNA alkyltransferase methyltransferase
MLKPRLAHGQTIDDALYEAVLMRTSAYDGRYYLGIRTTGIVCFPSCRSRPPKQGNILVYNSYEDAIHDGFRPCKRCRPDHSHPPDRIMVDRINALLKSQWNQPLSLTELGTHLNMSPSHLQRLYTRYCGISPQKARETLRMEHAQQLLLQNTELTITQVAQLVGFHSRSHFVQIFSRNTGMTPSAFRHRRSYNVECILLDQNGTPSGHLLLDGE